MKKPIKVTRKFLEEHYACLDGYKWWVENCEGLSTIEQINKLNEQKYDWANWLLVRLMDYKQCVSYAVFVAEQALHIDEEECLEDKRLREAREAIEAAKRCIDDPSEENKKSARAVSGGYDSNVYSCVARVAASSDDWVSSFAASAADYASRTYAASALYCYLFGDAYQRYSSLRNREIQNKIIQYGISLIQEGV